MKRSVILERLGYEVPNTRKKRVIIHSDVAAEADDQFAIAHHLLTPTEDVKGIIAANFEWRYRNVPALKEYGGASMQASLEEGRKLLELMEIDDIPLYKGAVGPIADMSRLPESEGADFIIKEAMSDSNEPLYLALQGNLTDLAIAYLKEPRIAEKITAAIWIGGNPYPFGGEESNMRQDIQAARIIFDSTIVLWQVPANAYSCMYLSYAELMLRVKPCGKVGSYLFDNMQSISKLEKHPILCPHGEIWSIGDSPTVSVLLQSECGSKFHNENVILKEDMSYEKTSEGREIRVYDEIDTRLTMEDFFSKLYLCYHK